MEVIKREVKTTAGRITGMAETRSPEEIADILGIEVEEIYKVLEKAGRPIRASGLLTCQKTGRWWKVRSLRGAYRLAMLKGLVDWDFTEAAKG